MPTHALIGYVCIALGLLDPVIGWVLASRMGARGRPLLIGMLASGVLLVGLGVAFLTGAIPIGGG